jgi:hypothetical protein
MHNKLLLELTQPDEAPLWGAEQEAKLFSRLNAVIDRDTRLSSRDIQLPPTVLPFLLEKRPASPRHLLDMAIVLREKDGDFVSYRRWYRELREAWAIGSHDERCERDVVAQELTRRYPPGADPLDTPPVWSREIGIGKSKAVYKCARSATVSGVLFGTIKSWSWFVAIFSHELQIVVLRRKALSQVRRQQLFLTARRV